MYKILKKKFLIFLKFFISLTFCFPAFSFQIVYADGLSVEKVNYTEDYKSQQEVDEELFDNESEYEEYYVYTEVPDEETDTNEIITLTPVEKSKKIKVLEATIEKSYSFRQVEAFNTIWDNSDNFRTLYQTVPSMMQTPPSIIHASYYKFLPDENTSVYWGHASLSSFKDLSLGFISKLESDYDSGLKIETKIGKINMGTAIYNSLETNNPSGGFVISSDELAFKKLKGSFILGGGVYTNEAGNNASSTNSAGLFTKYNYRRFSIGVQIAKNQYASGQGAYGTSFYLYPEYKLSDSLYLKSKFANHVDQQYSQEEVGLTFKPFKNNSNDFSVNFNTQLYHGQGTTNKQRFKLSTEFKL